jgi:hypothetical protein
MEDIIVLVNYIKIYRIRLASVPLSKEGPQDEDTLRDTLMRLEHEFEKYSTDEPVEKPSIARIPTRLQQMLPAIDHAMRAEFGVTQR